MVVIFEKASNYDPEKHEWVPKLEEVGLIYQTLKGLAQVKEIEQAHSDGVKGYLTQSLFVSTCFPSSLSLLLHFYAGS